MIATAFQRAGDKRWIAPGVVMVLLVLAIPAVIVAPTSANEIGFVGMVIGMSTAGIIFFRRSSGLERRERIVWRMIGVVVVEMTQGSLPGSLS
jgi:hypothetical protein